jgi:hypothetical protein
MCEQRERERKKNWRENLAGLKHYLEARCLWLMPVILASQELEISSKLALGNYFMKRPITKKGWLSGSSGKSACLANIKL